MTIGLPNWGAERLGGMSSDPLASNAVTMCISMLTLLQFFDPIRSAISPIRYCVLSQVSFFVPSLANTIIYSDSRICSKSRTSFQVSRTLSNNADSLQNYRKIAKIFDSLYNMFIKPKKSKRTVHEKALVDMKCCFAHVFQW